MMRRLFALLPMLALLCACAAPPAETVPDEPPTDTTPAEEVLSEQEPETATEISLAWTPDAGLDPYTCDNGANLALLPLLYEGLYVVQSDFTATPQLCQSATVSDDGLSWTLTLTDAQFSDGSAVTAADVVASLEAARAGRYGYLSCIVQAQAQTDRQVVLTLEQPRELLPLLLDFPITKNGTLGTGAYVLSDSRLVRNVYFSGGCVLGVEEIALIPLTASTDIRDAFEQGQISAVFTDPNAASAVTYHTDYELWTVPTTTMQYIGFQLDSPYCSNELVRRAISRAIDRQTIVQDTMDGFGAAAVLPVMPQSAQYDSSLAADYDFSPSDAAALLAEITWPEEEQACRMIVSSASAQRIAAAELIADALTELGIPVSLEILRYEDFLQALENGDYDLYYGSITLSADSDLAPFFDGSLPSFPENEALTLLNDQALENSGNCYTLYKAICDQGLFCPVAFQSQALYAARGAVRNASPAVGNAFWQATPEE